MPALSRGLCSSARYSPQRRRDALRALHTSPDESWTSARRWPARILRGGKLCIWLSLTSVTSQLLHRRAFVATAVAPLSGNPTLCIWTPTHWRRLRGDHRWILPFSCTLSGCGSFFVLIFFLCPTRFKAQVSCVLFVFFLIFILGNLEPFQLESVFECALCGSHPVETAAGKSNCVSWTALDVLMSSIWWALM